MYMVKLEVGSTQILRKTFLKFVLIILSVLYSEMGLSDLINNIDELNKKEYVDHEDLDLDKKKKDRANTKKNPGKKKVQKKNSVNNSNSKINQVPQVVQESKNSQDSNRSTNSSLEKKKVKDVQEKLPVIFEGDQLSGVRKLGTLELLDHVKVNQGDFDLTSDTAKVFFDTKTDDVKKVIAKGQVKMNKIDFKTGEPIKASSKMIVFDAIQQTVELIGKAELVKGEDTIRGHTIIYNLNTGWIKAEKVKGVVTSNDKENEPGN